MNWEDKCLLYKLEWFSPISDSKNLVFYFREPTDISDFISYSLVNSKIIVTPLLINKSSDEYKSAIA